MTKNKTIKPGDLVRKLEGRMKGKTGVILETHNPTGHTVFSVLTPHGIVQWAKQLVEVIK